MMLNAGEINYTRLKGVAHNIYIYIYIMYKYDIVVPDRVSDDKGHEMNILASNI